MGLNSLISKIDELKELVEGWRRGGEISAVEHDLALERVKRIYEQLRFPIEVEAVVAEPEPEPEVIVEPEPEPIPEPEPAVVEIEEEIELISIEPTPELEEVVAAEQQDDRKERRRKILSLYAEPEPVPAPVPEPSPEPIITPEPILPPQKIETQPSLNDQLGFNDRFLMANDLCQGDFEALGRALIALDRCSSMDDALIYIAEHYGWSGDKEGAKLLYSLLKSRYL